MDSLSPNSTTGGNYRKHDRFYFNDGNISLLISGDIYRIHKSIVICDSVTFADILSLPSPHGQESEGSSDENPIELKGQDKADFDCFLSFFYPSSVFEEQQGKNVITFLRVADKWQFESQKQSALRRIRERGTAAERIAVGRLYEEAKEMVVPAFMELHRRPHPPNEEEGHLLGVQDLITLWKIRHSVPTEDYRSRDMSFQDYLKWVIWDNGDPGSFPQRFVGCNDHYHFGPRQFLD